jgi:hypothetical protein
MSKHRRPPIVPTGAAVAAALISLGLVALIACAVANARGAL